MAKWFVLIVNFSVIAIISKNSLYLTFIIPARDAGIVFPYFTITTSNRIVGKIPDSEGVGVSLSHPLQILHGTVHLVVVASFWEH